MASQYIKLRSCDVDTVGTGRKTCNELSILEVVSSGVALRDAVHLQAVQVHSNMIFLPLSSVPPKSLPIEYPMYAPVTIVTGHFCHSRSLETSVKFDSLINIDSPIQGNRHGAQPSTQHRTNQTTIDLVNRQQERNSLPPCLATDSVYVDQRQGAQHRDVRAGEQRVGMVGGDRGTEEDEGCGQEGRRRQSRKEEGEEGGLYELSDQLVPIRVRRNSAFNIPRSCR